MDLRLQQNFAPKAETYLSSTSFTAAIINLHYNLFNAQIKCILLLTLRLRLALFVVLS